MQKLLSPLSLVVREGLRYRGGANHLMWIAHRLSGLGVLLFLILHIFGMSMAFFNPPLHEAMLNLYKSPPFAVGELILAVCMLYHAINGTRIALLELKPEWWTQQQKATRVTLIITAIVTLPWLLVMIGYTLQGLAKAH
ncbi:MAG: succinate dehydrogenase, cytochrome b556 subunit [Thermoflexales bacterium]|nr:succinate dehydrogenase, cytochrome b556 subunit [Thermoflexales bacterium]